jgi:hypothetical protein
MEQLLLKSGGTAVREVKVRMGGEHTSLVLVQTNCV